MQLEFLMFERMPLAQDAPLPHRQHLQDVGYKAQRVVRRQDRHANRVAHDHEQKQILEVSPQPRRLPLELVPGRAIEDLAERLAKRSDPVPDGTCHRARPPLRGSIAKVDLSMLACRPPRSERSEAVGSSPPLRGSVAKVDLSTLVCRPPRSERSEAVGSSPPLRGSLAMVETIF